MFKEFNVKWPIKGISEKDIIQTSNVKFEDVEILGDGTDSLLEGTEVTKVVLRGENNFSSLDSTLKNCNELDTIDGNLNLKDVTDIDQYNTVVYIGSLYVGGVLGMKKTLAKISQCQKKK